MSRRGGHSRGEVGRLLHHPRSGEAEVVLAGTAKGGVVQDPHADVLQGLRDLVGGVDVLLGRVALLSGVRFVWRRRVQQLPSHTKTVPKLSLEYASFSSNSR